MTYRSKLEVAFAENLAAVMPLVVETSARDLPGTPDIVIRSHQVAVFVHGCYWHSHYDCQSRNPHLQQSSDRERRLADIVKHDSEVVFRLMRSNWRCVIVWECSIRSEQSTVIGRVRDVIGDRDQRLVVL